MQSDEIQNMRSRIHLSESFTYNKLLRFTLPSIVMNVFTSLYMVVDGYFVANFAGKTEFAAVNLILPVLNILGTIGYMFGVGGSALIAKTLGENKPDRANRLFSMIVLVSSCLGFLMMVAGFIFMPKITAMLGAEGKLLAESTLYGRIFILALPAWILVYEFQLFFVAAEKPTLGLIVTVCAGLCNVFLDILFIICFRWGVAGAAAASALSQLVGGVFPLFYFCMKNDSLLKLTKPVWDGRSLVKCCINGSSEFMSEAAVSFVGIIYNVQLLKFAGEDGVATYGVLMYVCLIISAIFIGYSNGIGPVFSYHYGAKDYGELKKLRKKSLIIIVSASVALFIITEALAGPISAAFFHKEGKLLQNTVHAFRLYSVSYLFMGTGIFTTSIFTSLNNGEISALISFMRTLVFELGAILILPRLFGVDGIWCATVSAEFMGALLGCMFMLAMRKKYRY